MKTLGTKITFATMAGVSVTVALAGCSTSTSSADAEQPAATASSSATSGQGAGSTSAPSTGASDAASGASTYADGTYEAKGSYQSPNGQEEVDVSLTLTEDVITAVTVTPEAKNPTALSYQKQFADGIAGVVVGKDIDEIDVSRVAGSSLTSGGFNAAVESIKSDAAS